MSAPVSGNPAIVLPGVPATADPDRVIDQMVERACSPGFQRWWRRAESVGMCAHPIELVGTDEFGRQQTVWTRCNNRRAQVCPSCSDLYARDTWQLVHAGTAGGHHGLPYDVADRPQVFATLTAPGFGPVHRSATGTCRDHRRAGGRTRCPHGKPLWCNLIHDVTDTRVGQPLCPECYRYLDHVQFSWHLPELWRRFTIALRRSIARTLAAGGHDPRSVRVSFVKVVEMQARAVPHIHALIRLDPSTQAPDTPHHTPKHDGATDEDPPHCGPAIACDGGQPADRQRWISPVSSAELAALIQQVARSVTLTVTDLSDTAHPTDGGGSTTSLVVRFGTQIDTQPLTTDHAATHHHHSAANTPAPGPMSPRRVARYLAKYVTKSLQDLGISARRLSPEAIADLDISEHVRTILTTITTLADNGTAGIGRWLHTLGYRGHITTKSRSYSTTMGALRAHRATWARHRTSDPAPPQDDQQPALTPTAVQGWQFDHCGHRTLGDRTLVISAALRAIAARHLAREQLRETSVTDDRFGVPDG